MSKFKILPMTEVMGYGEADNGERLVVQVKDDQGVEVRILVPHEIEAHFNSQVSMAAMMASEKRAERGGHAETTAAIHIKQMQGLPVDRDLMVLRLRMANGMKLDMPLDPNTRAQLRDLLDKTEEKMAEYPPSRKN